MEQHKWPILDFFYGNNLIFQLSNNKDFSVQQIFHLSESLELPLVVQRATTYYDYIGFYGRVENEIQVYIQKKSVIIFLCQIQTQAQCYDIVLLDFDEILLACALTSQNIFYHCKNNEVHMFEDEFNSDIQDIRLDSYEDDKTFLIREVFGSNIITFWNWENGKLDQETQLTIDESKLNKLINSQFTFSLKDVQLKNQLLYILDRYQGLFELSLRDNQWQFEYQYKYEEFTEYMSFTINKNRIFITTRGNWLISCKPRDSDYFSSQINNIGGDELLINLDGNQIISIQNNSIVYFVYANHDWSSNLFRKEAIDIATVLSTSELIIFNQKSQKRYLLTSGYLILQPIKNLILKDTIYINAINDQCIAGIPFFYRVYDYMDNDIYVNKQWTITNLQYYPSITSLSDCPVTGSNLQESIKIFGRNVASIKTFFTKELLVKQLNATFVQILNANQQILYLTQKNLEVKVYQCDISIVMCYIYLTFNTITLNEDNFQWMYNSEVLIAVYNHQDLKLTIYTFQASQIHQQYSIQSKDPVIRIRMFLDMIFMIHKNSVTYYRYNSTGITYQKIIDEDSLSNDLNEDFSPNDVLLINSVYYAIVNSNTILFFWIDYRAILLNQLIFEDLVDLKAIIRPGLLIIIQSKGYAPIVEYYDISNLYDIKRQNIINLNAYKIQKPFQIYPLSKFRFILRVTHPSVKATLFIVIDIQALMRDQIITMIDTGVYIKDGMLVQIASESIEEQSVSIFSTGTQIKIINIFRFVQREISVNQEFKQVFLTRVTMQYEFSNIDSAVIVQSYDRVILLNDFTNLWNNVQQVDQYIEPNDVSTFINIRDDWFSGQILNYTALCSSCHEQVVIRQKLQKLHKLEFNSQLLSTCKYSDKIQIILTNQSVLFFNEQGFQYMDEISVNGGYKLICELNNSNFLIQTELSYLLLQCNFDLKQCHVYENLHHRVYSDMTTIIANYLMLIDDYEIQFLKIEIRGEKFQFVQNPYKLSAKDFGLSNIYSISNIHYPIKGGYRVLILSYTQGILHFDCEIKEYLYPNFQELIPLQTLLIAESIEPIMLQNTNYLNIAKMEDDNFLIITNTVHFAVTLTFAENQSKTFKLVSLLARYGEIYSQLFIVYSNGYVVMLYDEYPVYKLVIYRVHIHNDVDFIKDNPVLVSGGISTDATTWKFMYFSYCNELYFYYTDNGLIKCKINQQAQLIIRQSHYFEDKYMKLIAYNNKTAPVGIIINLLTEHVKTQKKFIWIVSGMLCLLVVIVIAFFAKRIRRQKMVSSNIQEE